MTKALPLVLKTPKEPNVGVGHGPRGPPDPTGVFIIKGEWCRGSLGMCVEVRGAAPAVGKLPGADQTKHPHT
jgi:hypothetical protein